MGTNNLNGNFRMGDNWLNTGVAVPIGRWMHLALTYSLASTTAIFYIDGQQVATNATYSIGAGGTNTALGIQFGGFGEFMAGTMDELRIWSTARTPVQIKQGMYGVINPATAGLTAYYQMNEGSGPTLGNATSTTGLDGTLVNSPAWVASPIQFATNALTFDGVDDQVIVQNSPIFDLTTGTIEASINPSILDVTNRCILGNRSSGNTRYSFHVSSTQVGLWNGTNFGTVNVVVPTGVWTTLSFVCDGTNTTVYENGTSLGALTVNGDGITPITFGTATGMTFDIGISKNAGVDGEPFAGSIDEVRVWSSQLTPTQINTYLGFTLSGNVSGLVALYSIDQGVPSGTNSNLITAIDNTTNNNHGTLMNFALTGGSSNFVTHPQTTLPVNFTSFTVTKNADQALLKWQTAQEQNSANFFVERSGDGKTYSTIGSVPAAGNSSTPRNYSFTDPALLQGSNYYRLRETDLDGRSMYSVVKQIFSADEATQKLVWYSTGSKAVTVNLLHGSNESFTLTNASGRSLQQGHLSNGKLYLSNMAAGVYIVKVFTANGTQLNAKLILQ